MKKYLLFWVLTLPVTVLAQTDSTTTTPPPMRFAWFRGSGSEWLVSGVGATALGPRADVSFLAPESTFGLRATVNVASRPLALFGWGTTYWLGQGGFVGFRLAVTPFFAQGGYRLYHNQLRAGWRWKLSSGARPLRLEAGLSGARFRINQDLGRFPNPDSDLRLNGKRFNAPNLDARLRRKGTQLNPSLGLSMELPRQREVFVEAAYLHTLSERNVVFFRESRGLFPRRTEIAVTDPSVRIPASQPGGAVPFDLQNWQVRAGMRFNRLR